MNLFSYDHILGVKINIYYENNPKNTIDYEQLNIFLIEIDNNIKKYMPNFFKDSVINIWDYRRKDIPKNQYASNGSLTSQGVGSYAGLCWASQKRVDINSRYTSNHIDMSNILSHELGHLIDYWTDDDNKNDIIMPEWKRIREPDGTVEHSGAELMAEDIRFFFGSSYSRGIARGSHSTPSKKKGLKDMLTIWHQVKNFVNSLKNQGKYIENVKYKYSDSDIDYFGVTFTSVLWILFIPIRTTYWIDRNAIYEWKNVRWVEIKKF